jgi:hypothetical protein
VCVWLVELCSVWVGGWVGGGEKRQMPGAISAGAGGTRRSGWRARRLWPGAAGAAAQPGSRRQHAAGGPSGRAGAAGAAGRARAALQPRATGAQLSCAAERRRRQRGAGERPRALSSRGAGQGTRGGTRAVRKALRRQGGCQSS